MNKKQLIARVQRYMGPGATRSTASAAVEAVLASIGIGANDGNGVCITRFGKFSKKLNSKGEERLTFKASRHFEPTQHQ